MTQFIYHMKRLNKSYGNKKILQEINLSFYPNAKIGILGPNSSGKSTLLRIMSGLDQEYTGEAWLAKGATHGYLPQEPKLNPEKTVIENILHGLADQQAILTRYNELMNNYSDETAEEGAKLQDIIDTQKLWDLESQVKMAMEALHCPSPQSPVTKLSGGETRRVALCSLLLSKPDLLLLDEPTNHLDTLTTGWLENYLREYPGAVILITHDRYFLDNITSWILEIDRGQGIPYKGNYSAYLEEKAKRITQEEQKTSARQKSLIREKEWMKSSHKTRSAKSKARIKNYHELIKQETNDRPGENHIIIPSGERLGEKVITLQNLSKGYGTRLLMKNINFELPAGAIVGVIGPNGIGKTTLFRIITGQEMPDSGNVHIGQTVHLGYIDQTRDSLDDNKTVWEEISDGDDHITIGKYDINSRAYCGAFNFKGRDQQQKVGNLSGGQRNRVHLAKLLKKGSNVLLLDEPTNDLDTQTLAALEDALERFSGCALIISHDRMFLDRLATHILAFEGNSHIEWFDGNFSNYEKEKRRRLGIESLKLQSVFKPLTR